MRKVLTIKKNRKWKGGPRRLASLPEPHSMQFLCRQTLTTRSKGEKLKFQESSSILQNNLRPPADGVKVDVPDGRKANDFTVVLEK